MFKKFLKEYWPDIVYGVFALLTIIFFFVPSFNLVLKDTEGSKSYFAYSIFDLLNGSSSAYSGIEFGPNYLLILFAAFPLFAFVFYYVAIFKKISKPKFYVIDNGFALIFTLISLFAVVFLDKYTVYFNKGMAEIINFKEIEPISYSYGIYLISLVAIALLTIRKLFDKMNFTIYDISEIAILCGLAIILDKVKIPIGATGGSINACAVPLFLISIRFGFFKGLISSSIVFGILSCMVDGYGFQYFPFDYLIAFSGYAVVGLVYHQLLKHTKKNLNETKRKRIDLINLNIAFLIGGIASWLTRMTGHIISSIVYYEYTFETAFIYNVIYVSFSILTSLVICCVLSKPIQIILYKYPLHKRVSIED